MSLTPFRAEHLALIQVQPAQASVSEYMTPAHARALESELSFTYVAAGRVLAVGGLVELWPNRATMWAYIDQDCGQHFIGLHRAALNLLKVAPYRRIEADVRTDFEQGHRWLKMLGFQLEAPCMRAHLPTGEDSALYARITSWQSH